MPRPSVNLQTLVDQLLMRNYSPPAVLVSNQGDILYISGRTGKYLEPAAGKANLNIFAMAARGSALKLTGAFQKAVREKGAITVKGCKVGINGGTQTVDITAQSIEEPDEFARDVADSFPGCGIAPAAKAPVRRQNRVSHRRQDRGTGAGTQPEP